MSIHDPSPPTALLTELPDEATLQQWAAKLPLFQGQLLMVAGHGVVLEGPVGCGKSAASLALLDRGHPLVADDAFLYTTLFDGRPYGFVPLPLFGGLTVRGCGLFPVASLYGADRLCRIAPLELCITLDPTGAEGNHPYLECGREERLGGAIPHLRLPFRSPALLPLLIENLVKQIFPPNFAKMDL